MQVRLDHVHVRSADPVAAAQFYIDAFDAKETARVGSDPVQRVVVDLAGLTVFLELAKDGLAEAQPTPHKGLEHIGLAVDNIEIAMAELKARGVPVVADIIEMRPGLRISFIHGPDQVLIELLERK
jgi:catechol 2,3-dioxygenase-like lactoylglutathione lyase family enzyme